MAFLNFFKRKTKRRGKVRKGSKIQEIRSPYTHRKSLSRKKLPKKAKNTRYSGELKLSYRNSLPWKKWLLILGGGAALLFFTYTMIFTTFFEIKQWKIYGDDIIQENSKFDDFFLVHKNENIVFLDTGEIKNTIISQYPEIENLKIKKVFPNTLVMEYENFPEVANLFNLVGDTQKKFIINEIGLLVEQDFENPNLPYIKLRTEKVLEIGDEGIPRKTLEYTLDAIYDFEELFGMHVLDAEYQPREREVHVKTERDFVIWLDTALTVQGQYNKLKKASTKLNINTESLEYIDLRISSINGDRVIFKRR